MTPPGLDDDFEFPERAEIDPSHIRALAVRIGNLDEDLKAIAAKVDTILERTPTSDEMKVIREILADKAGREYIKKAVKNYLIGGLGLLAVIYTTRPYLTQFF